MSAIENMVVALFEQQGLVLGVGGLGFLFYIAYQKFNKENVYENKEPEDVTRELLKKELENGNKVKKKLRDKRENSLITRGRILYELDDEMPKDPISPVIDPEKDEGDETGNVETDSGVWMFKVIPENKGFFEYLLKDVLIGMDSVAEYYIVEKDSVDIYNKEVVIKEQVFLDYERGVFTDRTDTSKNKPNMLLRLASQTELVKGHMNFAPKVIYNDTGHAMKSDIVERSKEEEDEI